MKSKKQTMREKRRRRKTITRIIWGAVAIILIAVIGYFVWNALKPAAGQTVPIMADTGHVEEGQDPGPYNTDPPTSGRHYANELEAGFYEEADRDSISGFPEGYLVHNLEHGYVIFWYNCDLVTDGECTELKSQIRSVLDRENNFKVIAFPWDSLKVPVVLTSWGQMQEFETFNPELAQSFVRQNRNQAPEPLAP
jgi:hypothetical protein